MTKFEAAIGARVKEFRERIEWPQSIFAYETGITRNKLAGIEYGTTPLRYDVAARICSRYSISRLWLAKGVGASQPNLGVAKEIEDQIPQRMLFSKAFSEFIEPNIHEGDRHLLMYNERTGATQLILPPSNVPLAKRHEWFVMKAFKAGLESVPPRMRAAYCDAVLNAIHDRRQVYQSRVENSVPLRASHAGPKPVHAETSDGNPSGKKTHSKGCQVMLDSLPVIPDAAAMQSLKSVPDLVAKLKQLSKKFGSKAALARKLKVSRQAVDQWLNGKTTPSTDIAIKVMNLE